MIGGLWIAYSLTFRVVSWSAMHVSWASEGPDPSYVAHVLQPVSPDAPSPRIVGATLAATPQSHRKASPNAKGKGGADRERGTGPYEASQRISDLSVVLWLSNGNHAIVDLRRYV
jgi:hypothetical protein